MGLLQRKGQITQSGPSTQLSGGTTTGTAIPSDQQAGNGFALDSGMMRWRSVGMDKRAAQPAGYREGGAWSLPLVAGGMAATVTVAGVGTVAPLNLAGGVNGAAALEGAGALVASGQLIVSAVAALSGIGGLSASALGKLNAAAALAGSGSIAAALGAIADAVITITGSGSLTGNIRADGFMSGEITPFTELSPQALAAAVWNALASEFAGAGTMGELLNGAGGGSSPGAVAAAVWDEATAARTTAGTFGKLLGADLYTAKVALVDDDGAGLDRYVVSWFRNGEALSAGITSPTISVVVVATGAELIASQAMTQIGVIGRFRFDAAGVQRTLPGAAYLAIVTATIGGATRSWDQPIGRDNPA